MIRLEEAFRFDSPKVTAASGLILANDYFYCVSDDETSLSRFSRTLAGQVERIPLFDLALPEDPEARKESKPDLEAIVHLAESGSILCIPSGSKPNRVRGAILDRNQRVREIGFENIVSWLGGFIPDLNLEGAVNSGSRILLFQRGNGKSGRNMIIELELSDFLSDQPGPHRVTEVDLGSLGTARLGFTDACMDQGSLWFLAAAESSDSTYEDGAFRGAILGRLCSKLRVQERLELEVPYKPEGLVVDQGRVFVVTDADDRSVSSRLFTGRL